MSYFRELVSKWTGKSNEGSRRKGMDYLICVAITTLLWLMNALSQDYSAELNYPVRSSRYFAWNRTPLPIMP